MRDWNKRDVDESDWIDKKNSNGFFIENVVQARTSRKKEEK
jgi:hypothetical protein